MEKLDYIIIGSGIVGTNVANLLSINTQNKKGMLIMGNKEHCASTANQTWLQPGGLYIGKSGIPKVSKLLAFNSAILVDRFDADLGGNGIFYFESKADANKVMDFNRKFNGYEGRFLAQNEIDDILGEEFTIQTKGFYITVPDRPFAEERILNQCLLNAENNGFEMLKAISPVILKQNASCYSGFSVEVNGRELTSDYTFIAAGIGTKKILKPLNIDREIPIQISKSLLLAVPAEIFQGKPNLYADRVNHLSVVKQKKENGNSVFLLGNGVRDFRSIDIYSDMLDKSLTFEEKNEFYKGFSNYPTLSEKIKNYAFDDNNYSVCFKIEQYDLTDLNKIIYEPLVTSFNNIYKGLYVAISGKATLGLYTAEKVLTKAGLIGGHVTYNFSHSNNIDRIIKIWYDNKNNN